MAIPVDWVILHWYAGNADGRSLTRSLGVRSRDYQIFSGGYHISLAMGLHQLQQHVAATDHSLCTGPATSCRHMLRRYIAVTNRFKCTGEIFWKSLSLQQNFVASTSRINSVWFDFLQHITAAKLCCRDKHFHTNSPVHTKRFVAVTCRCDLSLQLVA